MIKSGLNHVMHSTISGKTKFNKEVDKAYGDKADDIAPTGQDTINEVIENIPTLKKMKKGFGKEVSVSFVDKLTASGGGDAITYSLDNCLDSASVSVFRASFTSYRYLAQTVYHEFVHVQDYLSLNIYNDFKKYSNEFSEQTALDIALHLSEINAYHQTFNVTGLNYNSLSGYQTSVNFLGQFGFKF